MRQWTVRVLYVMSDDYIFTGFTSHRHLSLCCQSKTSTLAYQSKGLWSNSNDTSI